MRPLAPETYSADLAKVEREETKLFWNKARARIQASISNVTFLQLHLLGEKAMMVNGYALLFSKCHPCFVLHMDRSLNLVGQWHSDYRLTVKDYKVKP